MAELNRSVRDHRWRHLLAAMLVAGAGLSTTVSARQQPPVNRDAQLQQDLKQRIDKYMELHSRLEKQSPALGKTEEAAKIKASQDALAAALRGARSTARQGEIFTPEIAQLLRRLMYPETQGAQGTETKRVIEDDAPAAITLKVNASYPTDAPLPTVPPNLLASLPPLPKDLEYRFVNKDLILRDVHANLIVDFIPKAIR